MCFSISGKPIRTIRSMPLQRRLCPKSRLIPSYLPGSKRYTITRTKKIWLRNKKWYWKNITTTLFVVVPIFRQKTRKNSKKSIVNWLYWVWNSEPTNCMKRIPTGWWSIMKKTWAGSRKVSSLLLPRQRKKTVWKGNGYSLCRIPVLCLSCNMQTTVICANRSTKPISTGAVRTMHTTIGPTSAKWFLYGYKKPGC